MCFFFNWSSNILLQTKQVYFLPLPPLRLDEYDRSLFSELEKKNATNTEKLHARLGLWFSQGNARALGSTYRALKTAEPLQLEVKFEESKAAIANDADGRFVDFSGACSKRLDSKGKPDPIDAANFIRTLFWPFAHLSTTQFHPNMAATLLAEAAGLCSIIRQNGVDRVYAHPTAVRVVCENLSSSASQPNKEMFTAVLELCKVLEGLPQVPGEGNADEVGKLYEKMMLHFLRCRVMTAFKPKVKVAELLCVPKETALSMEISTRDPVPVVPVSCFPRAAWKDSEGKWQDSVADRTQVASVSGELPRSATVYTHKFNLVEDARLVLGDVYIAIQCKEYQSTSLSESLSFLSGVL